MEQHEKNEDIPKRFKTKNRFLKLILSMALLVGTLAGCSVLAYSENDGIDINDREIVVSSALNSEPDEIKTIEPPEDGWTLEQLNEVLYLNGQKIELPLMFSSLKDGYEIRDIKYYDNEKNSNVASGSLYYKNEFISLISFYELKDDFQITNLSFPPSYYNENQEYSQYISINGFNLNSGVTSIYNTIGNTFTKDSGFIKYVVGENEYTIIVSDVNAKEKYMIMIFKGVSKND